MYIEAVPNRNSPPAILLRESYRVDGKVKKRTLLNLSDWSPSLIEGLRALLKGGVVLPPGQDAITIKRSLPHGHVAAALGTLRRIGLDRLLGPAGNRCRDLVIAMIVTRLIAPLSKLATAKALDPMTAASSLGSVLGLGEVDEDELYTALDWLLERQPQIEAALAKRHLKNGTLVLYDVSSTYLEGRCCELGQLGYNRDGKRGKLQIVYGLLCAADGCPVAVEVFEGSTGDPATLATQIDKLKRRFHLAHVVLVGDRGMITQARLDQDIKPAGLDWITALRAPQIRALLDAGAFQLSLRRARPRQHHRRRLSGRAPHRLPQPRSRPRPAAQARGSARRHRARAGGNPQRRAPRHQAAARQRRDRPQGRRRHRQVQDGQALHAHHHRQPLRLRPQARRDRRRGAPRRHLRDPHQSRRQNPRRLRQRAGLQEPGPGRARHPQHQDRRSANPTDLPLGRPARARPRLPVHARLSCRMAHAPTPRAHAL